MKSLFGYEIDPPVFKRPLTAVDRQKKIQERREKALLKKKDPKPTVYNLSQFSQKQKSFDFIGQNVYIKPSYIVSVPEYCYYDPETGEEMKNPRLLTEAFIENQENLKDNSTDGKLSRKAITGLRNAINWLCVSAKRKRVFVKDKNQNFFFKVNFVTLTLPDTKEPIGSLDLQKKLLNPFLTYMRKYHGLRNYVWRLEFQANGKLHVHISTDTFLHHRKIRDAWNRLLDNNGYLEIFAKKYGHKDPNSTDVHATKKIKNMAAYLAKYMSKNGGAVEYPLKKVCDKIEKALEAGLSEKQISALVAEKKKLMRKQAKALGVMDWKQWYFQRINFWNSSFNPRPIEGRIWGCSRELSKANKLTVHLWPDEIGHLKCLMRPDIKYDELFYEAKPTQKDSPYSSPTVKPKKFGEIYFLTASDWFGKINGMIREAFDTTRWMICRDSEVKPVFEFG